MIGLLIGIATFVLLATGAIIELQDNLNIIWKAKPDQTFGIMAFVRPRLLSLTVVVGFGFLLMVSLILDAGLSWVGTYLEASFSGVTVILRILNSAIAFGIAALLFAMIFKILPAVPLTWRDVGMGAAMTALLFTAGKFAIGYYIGKSGVASATGPLRRSHALAVDLLLLAYPALRGGVHQSVCRESGQSDRGRSGVRSIRLPDALRRGLPLRKVAAYAALKPHDLLERL